MSKKHKDLQPWLDYFAMLRQYEQKGFLQMKPHDHEAYITRAALCSLSPSPSPVGRGADTTEAAPVPDGFPSGETLAATLTNLRAYAAWLAAATEGAKENSPLSTLHSQLKTPFALHIVKEDYPHDLLLTVLLQQKRTWYGRTKEHIEVIDYTDSKPEEK